MVVGLDDGIFHLPINDGDFCKKKWSKSEMIYFKSYQNQYAYRRKIMYNLLPGYRCEIQTMLGLG